MKLTKIVFLISLIYVTSTALGQGACCFSNGCIDAPNFDTCELLFGGVWMGEGTNCDTADCSVGACCRNDGWYECFEGYNENECTSIGGEFLGVLSSCDDEGWYCQNSIGACCFGGNDCWDSVLEVDCYSWGGEFFGDGTSCEIDAPWCFTYYGSCCFGDYCEENWEHDACEWSGGIFWLDPCDLLEDVEMCNPSGACCLPDGNCLTNVTEAYCSTLNGNYAGDLTSDCSKCMPEGACCIEFQCETIPFIDCLFAGGEWLQDETCMSDPCPDKPSCTGDLDANGTVDIDDLLQLLAAFGTSGNGDLDGDKDTDVDDVLIVISAWGECP